MLIGFSFFTGVANRVSSSQAVAVGKKVGALIVMIKSEYSNTVSGVMPYTTVNPSQTATVSTTGTVSGYGSGGYASGNYTADSTVTVPGGTATNFIPYSVVRNAYFASYWIQRDVSKIRFGANYGPLSDELRHKLERNAGVVINMVVRATPAFVANILEGDIVTKINDEDVIDAGGLNAQVLAHGGQTVQFTILRDTRSLIIPIALGTGA
jgi:S1-C subfamily serine protease